MIEILQTNEIQKIADLLNSNKIGVLPTDTIYGLHARVTNENLQKIRELKDREENMPFIYLISNVNQLEFLGINVSDVEKEIIKQYWPGPNTFILNTNQNSTQAIRLPDYDFINQIVNITGPLISTSANIHGRPFSKNITEAKAYFSDKVDFYVDAGDLNNAPSSIYKISDNKFEKIR